MANLILSGVNQTTGQLVSVTDSDTLVTNNGNIVLAGGVSLFSETTGIDATAIGTTSLHTVTTGKTVVITEVVVRVTDADTVTAVPTLGVGIAAGEDDIVFPQSLTGLSAIGDVFSLDVSAKSVIGSSGDVISLGIDTAATATTLTLTVDLIGYSVGDVTGGASADFEKRLSTVILSSAVSIPNAAPQVVDWDTEVYDAFNLHDNVTNPSRLTVDIPGVYLVKAQTAWATASGYRSMVIRKNGTDISASTSSPTGDGTFAEFMNCSFIDIASAGDYYEVRVDNRTGSALDFGSSSNGSNVSRAFFQIWRLGAV